MDVKGLKDVENLKLKSKKEDVYPWPADSKKWFSKTEDKKIFDSGQFWAAPFDARFPQQASGGRYCFTYYVDYHRCKTLLGEDHTPCEYFKKVYQQVCPNFYIEKWDNWVEEGRFPAHFDR